MYLKRRIDKFLKENPGNFERQFIIDKFQITSEQLTKYICNYKCIRIKRKKYNTELLKEYLDSLPIAITPTEAKIILGKSYFFAISKINHKNLLREFKDISKPLSYWELKDKETSVRVSKLKYKLDKIERKRFSHFSNNRISELYY